MAGAHRILPLAGLIRRSLSSFWIRSTSGEHREKAIHKSGWRLALGAAWPALASPDFQAIERERTSKQTVLTAQRAEADKVANTTGRPLTCPPKPLVLPLDHGPRPQTTPRENRLRKARYEAQVKACTTSAK